MNFTHMAFPAKMNCVMFMREASAVEREKKECNLEPVTGFAKIHTAYKNVKLFFSMHSIAMCYEQNFVFLELVLFGLKCKVLV
jgi:hypothetical protein